MVSGVFNVGVWSVVLLGLEIDVREWGLGNFSDNARDISKVVWKILKDNNVAGGKGFRSG